jgi:hypothetical protein
MEYSLTWVECLPKRFLYISWALIFRVSLEGNFNTFYLYKQWHNKDSLQYNVCKTQRLLSTTVAEPRKYQFRTDLPTSRSGLTPEASRINPIFWEVTSCSLAEIHYPKNILHPSSGSKLSLSNQSPLKKVTSEKFWKLNISVVQEVQWYQ